LFGINPQLKKIRFWIGSKLQDKDFMLINIALEKGIDQVVFYPSLIKTDCYLPLVKRVITQVRDQKGMLMICTIFSDENSSKDLGRYFNVEIYSIYYSNYLKMFQMMFDPEDANIYEKLIEAIQE